jgi:mitochondrial GTPase 1
MIDDLLVQYQKRRIIVLNKSDLCNSNMISSVESHLKSNNRSRVVDVIHTNAKNQETMQQLYDRSLEIIKADQAKNTTTYKIFVVGMPNVGKSSIINSFKRIAGAIKTKTPTEEQQAFLDSYKSYYGSVPFTLMDNRVSSVTRTTRGGKKKGALVPCKTGAKPGVTKSIEPFVLSKSNPRILCLDSPGIMVPKLFDPHQALRLAVVGVRTSTMLSG